MKIICVGRNYVDHAKELNNPVPKQPLIFLKPDTCILKKGAPFFIPEHSNNVQHEIELVVKINRIGKHIEERFAHKYFEEISLGLDFTARDIQQACKEKGHPWELAKSFDGSSPIGRFIPLGNNNLTDLNFRLEKNGEVVQKGNTKDMIFDIHQIISYVSRFFTLKIGDLIYTGTPSGVSSVQKGDQLVGILEDQELLKCKVL